MSAVDVCAAIEAPSESFNRWLLERRVVDRNPVDALLPASCPTELSPSMYREIINDIPLRLVKPKYQADARRQLVKYAEAAQRMIESRAASSENRKLVKWHAEDALEWMRRQRNASYEDYLVCVPNKPLVVNQALHIALQGMLVISCIFCLTRILKNLFTGSD